MKNSKIVVGLLAVVVLLIAVFVYASSNRSNNASVSKIEAEALSKIQENKVNQSSQSTTLKQTEPKKPPASSTSKSIAGSKTSSSSTQTSTASSSSQSHSSSSNELREQAPSPSSTESEAQKQAEALKKLIEEKKKEGYEVYVNGEKQ